MSLEAPSYSYYFITTVGAQSLYLLFSCGKKNIPCGVPSCSVGYTLCKYCCSVVVCYERKNFISLNQTVPKKTEEEKNDQKCSQLNCTDVTHES